MAGQDTRSEKAFALLGMGIRDASSQSVSSLEQSLALYRALDDQWWSAYVLIYWGWRAHNAGDYGKAKQLWEESLALYRALGDQKETAEALLYLGWAAWPLGDYREAKQLWEESLALCQALGDQRGTADSLQSLGNIALYQGQFEEAERLARECIAISREIGYRHGTAVGLRRSGMALIALGKYADAQSQLEEGAAIHTDMGGRPNEVAFQNKWLGRAKVHLGRYEQARALGQMCLNLAQEHGFRREIGLSLLLLGDVALAGEAYAEAQGLLQESVIILQEIGHRPELGPALADLGIAALELGQLPQARQHLHEALQTGAEIEAFIPLILALPAAALLLSDQGEPERAVELYALASRYSLVASSRGSRTLRESTSPSSPPPCRHRSWQRPRSAAGRGTWRLPWRSC